MRLRTVVFDLDDTLYSERDYLRSGLLAITDALRRDHGVAIDLAAIPEERPLDAILRCCPPGTVELDLLLSIYRAHTPAIRPRPGATALISDCRSRGESICILTDGRSSSQRAKLAALGLDYDQAFISEELGATKPSEVGFRAIEGAWPAETYVYVADNPTKDFIAPNKLGWLTFGLSPRSCAIHGWSDGDIPPGGHPHHWVTDLHELRRILAAPPTR
jgi:putative hydrolase of the HAD superfamily